MQPPQSLIHSGNISDDTPLTTAELRYLHESVIKSVLATLPAAFRPADDGSRTGFMHGKSAAYTYFPMYLHDIPRGLFTPFKWRYSPPVLHLGYIVKDQQLIDAAYQLRCVAWIEKEDPPPKWDPTKSADEQPVHVSRALVVDEFATKANLAEVLRDHFEVDARIKQVCITMPTIAHQCLSLYTNVQDPELLPLLSDMMRVAKLLRVEEEPFWYPDYMLGDWRHRTNDSGFFRDYDYADEDAL